MSKSDEAAELFDVDVLSDYNRDGTPIWTDRVYNMLGWSSSKTASRYRDLEFKDATYNRRINISHRSHGVPARNRRTAQEMMHTVFNYQMYNCPMYTVKTKLQK